MRYRRISGTYFLSAVHKMRTRQKIDKMEESKTYQKGEWKIFRDWENRLVAIMIKRQLFLNKLREN